MRTRVCLDFDGVIHHMVHPHISHDLIQGEPVEGAREWCWKAYDEVDLVISSGRCCSPAGVKAIEEWLEKFDFPKIPVYDIKPVAHIYIDDRGWRFTGNWNDINIEDLIVFRPWWEKTKMEVIDEDS